MGLLDFLSTLASGVSGVGQMDPDDPRFAPSPNGYVAPMDMQAPQPQAPQMPQAAPQPDPSQDPSQNYSPQDITVMGDTWRPKKGTILGGIADAIANYTDGTTPFADQRDKQNLEDASKGFTEHPLRSISRIAKVDPDRAYKLYNEYLDNQRQSANLDRQNRYLDLANENLVYQRAAAAMAKATPDTWGPMREQIIRMGAARHVDLSGIIPKQYDADSIDTIVNGAFPVAKQKALDETHEYHQDTNEYRHENLGERRDYHQGELAQGSARIGEEARHHAVTEGQGAARINDSERKVDVKTPRQVKTKYGPGTMSGDGMHLRILNNGEVKTYSKVGNTWVRQFPQEAKK